MQCHTLYILGPTDSATEPLIGLYVELEYIKRVIAPHVKDCVKSFRVLWIIGR
jgi:hypothetical protein